jgi:hypothetical protein
MSRAFGLSRRYWAQEESRTLRKQSLGKGPLHLGATHAREYRGLDSDGFVGFPKSGERWQPDVVCGPSVEAKIAGPAAEKDPQFTLYKSPEKAVARRKYVRDRECIGRPDHAPANAKGKTSDRAG